MPHSKKMMFLEPRDCVIKKKLIFLEWVHTRDLFGSDFLEWDSRPASFLKDDILGMRPVDIFGIRQVQAKRGQKKQSGAT
jgi:hypothetical protein